MRERAAAVGGILQHRSGARWRLHRRGCVARRARRRGGRMIAMAPVRIVVADDHQVVRDGFAGLLDTQPDFTVVGTASDGAEAVQICGELRPDVVLMDVRMPSMDGIEATRQLAVSGCGRTTRPHPDNLRSR